MVREILTLNIGQAGVQLTESLWDQFNTEHKIDNNGKMNTSDSDDCKDNAFRVFYEETKDGKFVPRNLSIDTETNVIDEIKKSKLSKIFNPQFLISSKEDASNNFGRGYYSIGREIINLINDKIRKLSENCDNFQGFIINHSVSGGTGSGLGALILENIASNHKKKTKFGFEIYPSANLSNSIVEPYNSLLTTHWLTDFTEVSIVLDNEALYNICHKKLNITSPSYENINKLICKLISGVTYSLRFEGEINVDLNEFQTNLVPFPRLHFMISGMSRIISDKNNNININDYNVQKITDEMFNSDNWFIKMGDFDVSEDKYMAISLNFRGDVKSKEAGVKLLYKLRFATVQWLKSNNKVSFVEWCPTGFKIGLNEFLASKMENDNLLLPERSCNLIANNVCIKRLFNQRICKKFDKLYNYRAFLHWFIKEGIEEYQLNDARNDLNALFIDYLEVLKDFDTDSDYSSSDEDEDDY